MDVLRENIGLLQLDNEYYYDEEPINEFSLFSKKKTRWERFKDALQQNPGKVSAAITIPSLLAGRYIAKRLKRRQAEKNAEKVANEIIAHLPSKS